MWLISTIGAWVLRAASSRLLQSVAGILLKSSDNATQIALKQIDVELTARAAARDIRLATAGYWELRLITALIAGSFTLHLCVVTLDTVFKLGLKVAKFPTPFDEWEGAILLSFFGVQAGVIAVRGVVAAIMGRR